MPKYLSGSFFLALAGLTTMISGCRRSSQTPLVNPVISSIKPLQAPPQELDTIVGLGFSAVAAKDSVFFNGLFAPVISASNTQLVVHVPVGATTGPVSVRVNDLVATGPIFTYVGPVDDAVMVSTLAGSGVIGDKDGDATTASFSFIWGVAADDHGNVFVADGDNNLIRKVTSAGMVSTVAGRGSVPQVYGGGPFFYSPEDVAVDKNGVLYVTNTNSSQIVKIVSGTASTWVGMGAPMLLDGLGDTAEFNYPTRLVVDKDGNVYVADTDNNAIRKITPDRMVRTLAGAALTGPGSDDGVGRGASFFQPWGLAVDGDGNVYVGDLGNCEIRKITPDGVVTTLAGHVGGGDNDGVGAAAGFEAIYGLAVDANGMVYFVDHANNKIRRMTPGGYVTTIAGTGEAGSHDGPGKTATFNQPTDIAVGGDGAIYVADGSNFKIRKIVIKH